MVDFFMKRIFRVKNHLIYGAMAQVVLMAANVLILVSSNFDIPYTIFQSVVPTYIYLALITLFYLLLNRLNRKVTGQRSIFSKILCFTIIAANVVYTLITTFDETGILYYLDTVIIQAINAFYISVYVSVFGNQYAHGGQLNLLRIFSYGSAIAILAAFYFCFVNMLVAWALIVITTVLLFATYLLFHENYKKTLPKRKVLRSHAIVGEDE